MDVNARLQTPSQRQWSLLIETGLSAVATDAPRALWSGAGTGHARGALLRAHPLLDRGIINAGVFGRTLTHGGAEWQWWRQLRKKPLRIAPAVFVDSARASRRLGGSDSGHVDAGVGCRVSVPGAGVLRLDLARGLDDRRTAFSIGLMR
jgi:hypothetical protein